MKAEPERLSQLPRRTWRTLPRRLWREFRQDNLPDLAAALTYYAVLSIFPGLIVLVSLMGLIGQNTIASVLDDVGAIVPSQVIGLLREGMSHGSGTSGVLAVVGLLVALWSSSRYVAAFIRAGNTIYDIAEGRPFWKLTPLRVGLTLLLVVLMAAGAVMVTLTGRFAELAGRALGFSSAAVSVWEIAKWPALLLIVLVMVMLLYWAAPNVRQPGFRWISPGGALAVLLWLLVSGGFALYVANFSAYDKTYGTLGAIVVFMVWLWLSNLVILLGAELDAELVRSREITAGHPAEAEPYAEPRDQP